MISPQKPSHLHDKQPEQQAPQKAPMDKTTKILLIYCGILLGILIIAAPIIIIVRKNTTNDPIILSSSGSSSPDMKSLSSKYDKKNNSKKSKNDKNNNKKQVISNRKSDTLSFNFETGKLKNCTITDGRFGRIISNRELLWKKKTRYRKEGKHFLTTHEVEDKTNKGEDNQTGTITSKVFKLKESQLNVLIGGGTDKDTTYFAMYLEDGTEIFRAASKKKGQQFYKVQKDLSSYLNENVYWQVVDKSTDSWGFITVDDIRFSKIN